MDAIFESPQWEAVQAATGKFGGASRAFFSWRDEGRLDPAPELLRPAATAALEQLDIARWALAHLLADHGMNAESALYRVPYPAWWGFRPDLIATEGVTPAVAEQRAAQRAERWAAERGR